MTLEFQKSFSIQRDKIHLGIFAVFQNLNYTLYDYGL